MIAALGVYSRFPRTCGDRPVPEAAVSTVTRVPPHLRG